MADVWGGTIEDADVPRNGGRRSQRKAAKEAAARAGIDLIELGLLGALNYSKAYDRMDQFITGRAVETTGIPREIVGMLPIRYGRSGFDACHSTGRW